MDGHRRMRKTVYFPSQAEAARRRRNRRRTIVARTALLLTPLTPLAMINGFIGEQTAVALTAIGAFVFVMACISGAHDNDPSCG